MEILIVVEGERKVMFARVSWSLVEFVRCNTERSAAQSSFVFFLSC